MTDLLDDDHRDLPIAIARKLYEFHHIHRYSPLLPVDKKPGLWTRLKNWVDRVSDFGVKGIKFEKLGNLIDLFEDKFSRSSLSGFCHNNICDRNILRWKSERNHLFLTVSLLKSKAIILCILGLNWHLFSHFLCKNYSAQFHCKLQWS